MGMDRRAASVDEAHLKVTDNVKELCVLLKTQEKANFTIKGTIWRLKMRFADIALTGMITTCSGLAEGTGSEDVLFLSSLTWEVGSVDFHVINFIIYIFLCT